MTFSFKRTFGASAKLRNSGVHHLEEIREAGLETPAVNQIEVCILASGEQELLLNYFFPLIPSLALPLASPVQSAKADRGVLSLPWYCHPGLLSSRARILYKSDSTENSGERELAHIQVPEVSLTGYCRKIGRDPAQVLIRWSLQKG